LRIVSRRRRKGDGPISGELKKRPPDLTILAKKNGGVFPLDSVYRIIDGREEIASHGNREMPVWGYRFVPPKHFDLRFGDDYIYPLFMLVFWRSLII
jgi:hypothetical protein